MNDRNIARGAAETMKKEIVIPVYVGAVLVLLWILAAATFSRLDRVEQTPADLAKYPGMQGFFAACGEFEGGTLDIDSNVMKLAYRTTRTPKECLEQLDRAAKKDGWVTVSVEENKCVFTKTQRRYPADTSGESVAVSVAGDTGAVELVWR